MIAIYTSACCIVVASASGLAQSGAVSFALAVTAIGSVLATPSPPEPPKRITHASEIADFPDTIGRMLQGDLIVLAPRPKTHARQLPDENNLFIIGPMLRGSSLRTVMSLATGDHFALLPDRRCCRVDAKLEVTTAAGR